MRFDNVGMFWEDFPAEKGRAHVARIMPEIPETGWRPPTTFPDLSRAKVLTIDVETKDPEFTPRQKGDRGPGWARGVGHIVGIAVGADNDGKWYFPMRHEVQTEYNLDPEKVLAWARVEFARKAQPKIGANLTYDVGWLQQEGVFVKGDLVDVQFAEALLMEKPIVNLDHLGEKYCGEGKTTNLLYQWLSDYYSGPVSGKQRANIYRAPPTLTGPYALSDITLPRQVIKMQYPLLQQEGLLEVFSMECKLIPLMVAMRFAGATVDLKKAESVKARLEIEQEAILKKMRDVVGFDVNVNASASLAEAFDKLGLAYARTNKGNPSFTAPFLDGLAHPFGAMIREARKVAKIKDTFVQSYILDANVKGRVYCQFHLLRGDTNGTRSGRYSSSTPNLQNVPSRDEELAPIVRSMFVPDEGHRRWRKYDFSQIEYRFLAHYAVGDGSDNLRQILNDNPDSDYHEIIRQLIKQITGQLLERKPTKNINFGLLYGMGLELLALVLGLDPKVAKKLFKAYHQGAPFVRATMEDAMAEVHRNGFITTVMGRRSRFDLFEPAKWSADAVPLPYSRAVRAYGDVRRAYTYKALNRRLQGSAADQMKLGMLRCWEDGIFDRTGIPRLTVHDELNFSDDGSNEADKAFIEMQHVLENSMKLKIPIYMEGEYGDNWGFLKNIPRGKLLN